MKKYCVKYYLDNRDEIKKKSKKTYEDNKEAINLVKNTETKMRLWF